MSSLLKRKLAELDQQLIPLKKELDRANSEAEKWAEERTAIHKRIRELKREAADLKQRRDKLNVHVQNLKSQREKARVDRKEKQAQIMKLREGIHELMGKKPSQNGKSIQREIENLDWRIQTSSLPLEEEKFLIDQVRVLETKLSVYKKIQELGEKLTALETEQRTLETKARDHHRELSELAKQSQQSHEEMLETLSKIRPLQNEADDMHQKFLKSKQQAEGPSLEYTKLLSGIKSLKQELHHEEETVEAERQLKLQKKLEERALEKLKRGEKLTWEEFKALADQGIV